MNVEKDTAGAASPSSATARIGQIGWTNGGSSMHIIKHTRINKQNKRCRRHRFIRNCRAQSTVNLTREIEKGEPNACIFSALHLLSFHFTSTFVRFSVTISTFPFFHVL